MKKTFLIAGNFRGGTTATTTILKECGIYLGDNLPYNLEDNEWQRLLMGNAIDLDAARLLIQKRNAAHDTWGFKYPGLHTRLRGLVHMFRNPHVILVFRDPLAVAISEENRAQQNKELIMKRTISYNTNMMNLAKELRCPVHLVSFERLLTRTQSTVSEIMDFIGAERGNNYEQLETICSKIQLVPENQEAY